MSDTRYSSHAAQSGDDTKTIHGSRVGSAEGPWILRLVRLYTNPDYIMSWRWPVVSCWFYIDDTSHRS